MYNTDIIHTHHHGRDKTKNGVVRLEFFFNMTKQQTIANTINHSFMYFFLIVVGMFEL